MEIKREELEDLNTLYNISKLINKNYDLLYDLERIGRYKTDDYNKQIEDLKRNIILFDMIIDRAEANDRVIKFLDEKSNQDHVWIRIHNVLMLKKMEKEEPILGKMQRHIENDIFILAMIIASKIGEDVQDREIRDNVLRWKYDGFMERTDLEEMYLEDDFLLPEHPYVLSAMLKSALNITDVEYDVNSTSIFITLFLGELESFLYKDNLEVKDNLTKSEIITRKSMLRAILALADDSTYEMLKVTIDTVDFSQDEIREVFSYRDKDREIPNFVFVRRKQK